MKTLQTLREQIDSVDRDLLALLNRRADLAHEVGELKRAEGSAVFRPEREAQVIAALQTANAGRLLPDSIAHVWREIMSACRTLEAPQRVACLGPAGTFSEEAALGFFGSSVHTVLCTSIDEVFHAAEAGSADFGVVPLENSTEGVITRSLDLLLHSPLHIVGEVSLKVVHHLLRQQATLENVTVVAAHAQALAQCQGWLSKHLPQAERHAVASNAEGARLAREHADWAAIGSARAAAIYGLHAAADAIQDEAFNRTRFGIVCLPQVLARPEATGRDSTSLVVSVPNRPGAMHDLLLPLKEHGVSMTRFESRPARSGQWEYVFYIDVSGHPATPHVAQALEALRRHCAFYKELGTYPVAD